MNNIFMKPGIKKYKFIVNIFTTKIILTINPYIESVNTKDNKLSIISKSFENLLVNWPVGVISK
jgi:hypothetical protein